MPSIVQSTQTGTPVHVIGFKMSCEAPPTQSKPAFIVAERGITVLRRSRRADGHTQSVLCNIVKTLGKIIPTFQKGAQSSLPCKR